MYFGAALIAAGGVIWTAPPTSAAMQRQKGYYKAASGNCVHRPVCNVTSRPPGATVQCPDGCWSFSEHPDDDNTCHGHSA